MDPRSAVGYRSAEQRHSRSHREIIVRLRITTVAVLLAAIAAAVILSPGTAQAAWDMAGYTWSNITAP